MYTYECNTIRVIDGNTVDAVIDLGFNVTIRQRIKLYGVNVDDIRSTDENKKNNEIKCFCQRLNIPNKKRELGPLIY